MIYLQEKGLLQTLMSQFKSRNTPENKNDSAAKDNVMIVESVCDPPVEKIQTDFESWFNKKYNFNLYGKNPDQYYRMEYNYMLFEEVLAKTSNMLSSMQANTPFFDSAKTALKTINEKFDILKHEYNSYNDTDKMREFDAKVESLKTDLFKLYNKVESFYKK